MKSANTISDELKQISPAVAAIGNKNLFEVPPAYFDTLAVQIMLRIAVEEKAGLDPALNISKNNPYHTPDHYFDHLAGSILQRIKAQQTNARDELALLSPLLGKMEQKNPFSLPDGYFTDFSDNVVAGVKAIEFVNEELENLSPTMAALRDKQVYEVPNGYFDALPINLLDKARQQQPAKLVSLGVRKAAFRYAAAAVVTGILFISGYSYYAGLKNQPPGNGALKSSTLDAGLAKIPDQEIESFLNYNTASVADTSTIVTADDDSISEKDAKDLLANISDEELQHYVDQRPESPISN